MHAWITYLWLAADIFLKNQILTHGLKLINIKTIFKLFDLKL